MTHGGCAPGALASGAGAPAGVMGTALEGDRTRIVIQDIRPRTPDPWPLRPRPWWARPCRVPGGRVQGRPRRVAGRVLLPVGPQGAEVDPACSTRSATTNGRRRCVPGRSGPHRIVVRGWTDRHATWAAPGARPSWTPVRTSTSRSPRATDAAGAEPRPTPAVVARPWRRSREPRRDAPTRVAPALAPRSAAALWGPHGAPDLTASAPPLSGWTGSGPVRGLVRAVPPLARRASRGGRARVPDVAGHGFRRAVPPAHPSHRHDGPEGPEQHPGRRRRRSGQPVGHRQRRRRSHRHPPRARDHRGLFTPGGRGARPRHGGGARLRPPVLARPPVGDRASRVVPPPPRRLHRLRRESAEGVPGHLPDQLLARRRGGPGGAVGRVQGDPRLLDRTGRRASSGSTTRTPSRSPSGSG